MTLECRSALQPTHGRSAAVVLGCLVLVAGSAIVALAAIMVIYAIR